MIAFLDVKTFGLFQEGFLERLFVDGQTLTLDGGLFFVQAEFDVTVDDTADQARVDGLAVSLAFDQLQDGVGDTLVELLEQAVAPRHQRQLIDLVDALTALLALSAHPVPVQVRTDAVQHLRTETVVFPLARVEGEHVLVHEVGAAADQVHQVVPQEVFDPSVQLEAHQLGAADLRRCGGRRFFRTGAGHRRTLVGVQMHAGTVVVDVCVQLHVTGLGHRVSVVNMFDAVLQVAPYGVEIIDLLRRHTVATI